MNESNHTKGPWSLHPYQNGDPLEIQADPKRIVWQMAIGSGKTLIAVVDGSTYSQGYSRPNNQAETIANANLIAAAPEMLEVLKDSLFIESGEETKENILERTLQIIAKAEGGAE